MEFVQFSERSVQYALKLSTIVLQHQINIINLEDTKRAIELHRGYCASASTKIINRK